MASTADNDEDSWEEFVRHKKGAPVPKLMPASTLSSPSSSAVVAVPRIDAAQTVQATKEAERSSSDKGKEEATENIQTKPPPTTPRSERPAPPKQVPVPAQSTPPLASPKPASDSPFGQCPFCSTSFVTADATSCSRCGGMSVNQGKKKKGKKTANKERKKKD